MLPTNPRYKKEMNLTDHPLDALVRRYPECGAIRADLDAALQLLLAVLARDGTLWLCGNGGSAADCEHWAGELLKSFAAPRTLPPEDQAKLPADIAGQLQPGFRAIPMTGFPSFTSAFGNDVTGRSAFAQLTWVLGWPGDVLIAISTSGDSTNILQAAAVARAKGMQVLGLTGRTGGGLAPLCDCCIRVPRDVTHEIQELHLPVYHALSLAIEQSV